MTSITMQITFSSPLVGNQLCHLYRVPNMALPRTAFFALLEQPRRVAVIGGGYIGVELSGVLNALGSNVTTIALEDRLMERVDPMISLVLEKEKRVQAIQIRTGFQVTALTKSAGGLVVHSTNNQHLATFDTVIWAVGRRPNTANLVLEAAGVQVMPNCIIPVDEYENTNVEKMGSEHIDADPLRRAHRPESPLVRGVWR